MNNRRCSHKHLLYIALFRPTSKLNMTDFPTEVISRIKNVRNIYILKKLQATISKIAVHVVKPLLQTYINPKTRGKTH